MESKLTLKHKGTGTQLTQEQIVAITSLGSKMIMEKQLSIFSIRMIGNGFAMETRIELQGKEEIVNDLALTWCVEYEDFHITQATTLG